MAHSTGHWHRSLWDLSSCFRLMRQVCDGYEEPPQDPMRCGILGTALIAFALPLVVSGPYDGLSARTDLHQSVERRLRRIGCCLQWRLV